ncbi:hypothetical protein ACGFXC_14790 [Streptomyces sp. NPDC048507]|uniref:hypothetical protein n=1 Tax=Streptomyces sp. NPDC048507 TaxID=3365560 RepID=UPI00370FFAA0
MISSTDPAETALGAVIHGPQGDRPEAPLIARAVSHWARSGDPYGWSRMYPPAQYRQALRRAGYADPDLGAIDGSWSAPAAARFAGAAGDPAEQIWAVRLLLLMGLYEAAADRCDRIGRDDPEASEWSGYLRRLIGIRAPGRPSTRSERPAGPAGSPLLRLNESLLALSAALPRAGDGERVTTHRDAARELADDIRQGSPALGAAADARVLRALIPWHRARREFATVHTLVRDQLDRLDQVRHGADPATAFVLDEAARRVLDAVTVESLRERLYGQADEWSQRTELLDPHCARGRLLHGIALERLGHGARAVEEYRKAARYGIAERSFARMAISRLAGPETAAGCDDDLAAWHDGNDTANRWQYLADGSRSRVLARVPIDATALDALAARREAGPSVFEQRFAPYLTMAPAAVPAPLFAAGPRLAWDAHLGKDEPWFSSLYLQRSMVNNFRAELTRTAIRDGVAGARDQADFASWLRLPGDPARDQLARALADRPDDPLVLARLARVVSCLGFQEAAYGILDAVPGLTGPEYAYARSMRLFLGHVIHLGRGHDQQSEIERVFAELDDDPRHARIRLSLCIVAIVTSAQSKQLPALALWHGRGLAALERYTGLPEVDDFERTLMTSRFYRAAAFEPFLNKRQDQLRADLDRWLGLARELTGHDARTRLLARENLFPALESAARTEAALGNTALGRELMEEITSVVDPLDSKAWLQVADGRKQAGDVRGALTAYLNAARRQVPLGRVAWFGAGRCWEKLGDPQEAFECYRRSLEYWPTGLAPAQRISALSAGRPLEAAYARALPALRDAASAAAGS